MHPRALFCAAGASGKELPSPGVVARAAENLLSVGYRGAIPRAPFGAVEGLGRSMGKKRAPAGGAGVCCSC